MTVHRVGWLFEHPTLSGGERSALEMLGRLPAFIEPVALAPPGALADALQRIGCPVVPLQLDRRGSTIDELVGRLFAVARAERLDLLHANTLSVADLTGPVPLPSVGHVREIGRISRARMERLSGNARLVAVSHAVARNLIEQGAPESRVVVCHNGIDLERWNPARIAPAARPANRLLLSAGQLVLRKGHDLLLEAIALLDEPLELWIAGERWSDKPEARAHEAALHAAARRGPHPVRFLGWRDDLPALLAAADLLVHPARQEPLSRVILEAMALGCPVVATGVGGTAELLPPECLVPPGDPRALAAAIRAAPRGRQPGLRALCRERFAAERALAALLAVYREVLG